MIPCRTASGLLQTPLSYINIFVIMIDFFGIICVSSLLISKLQLMASKCASKNFTIWMVMTQWRLLLLSLVSIITLYLLLIYISPYNDHDPQFHDSPFHLQFVFCGFCLMQSKLSGQAWLSRLRYSMLRQRGYHSKHKTFSRRKQQQ